MNNSIFDSHIVFWCFVSISSCKFSLYAKSEIRLVKANFGFSMKLAHMFNLSNFAQYEISPYVTLSNFELSEFRLLV